MIIALLIGCGGTNGATGAEECGRGATAEGATAPATEDQVRELLGSYAPTQVSWAYTSTGDTVSPLSIGIGEGTDSVQAVEYPEQCPRAGVALFVPVLFTVVVGADDVVATIDDGVEAFGTSLSDVMFPGELSGDAALSDTWSSAALGDTGADLSGDPDEWTLSLDGSLESGELGVHGHYGAEVGSYWRGVVE
jgi:hypothetical protein